MSVIRGRRFRNLEQFHGIESMTIDNRDIQCTIAAKRAFFVYQDRASRFALSITRSKSRMRSTRQLRDTTGR